MTPLKVFACLGALFLTALPEIAASPGAEDVDHAVQALTAAAGGHLQVRRSEATGVLSFLTVSDGASVAVASGLTPDERAIAFAKAYAPAFGLAADSDLRVSSVQAADAAGMDHVRLQEVYRGVPVTGAEMTVHLRGKGVVAVLSKTLPDLSGIEIEPEIEAAAASVVATKAAARDKPELALDAITPRLEIFNRGLLEGAVGVTRLAWFVEVKGEAVRDYVWVDARRGVVLLRFSQLTEATNRQVFTAKSGPALPGTLVRSEGQPATGDPDADAAYDFAGDTLDYFLTVHGRDSFDGAGAPIVSTVHYCPTGQPCPYPNAAWNGAQMIYGEGFSRADDVDAHELTHAVTERTANLFYYMQSGALNESISDIFGETVDLTNGKGNDDPGVRWLIGEDIPGQGAIRNMMNPSQFGDPGGVNGPGSFHCLLSDNGGVHENSGVPNHAYALLVDGGDYNSRTIVGIGLSKASRIVYRALTSYLTSASNFSDFGAALGQSCLDLVGGPSGIIRDDCDQVSRVVEAVGLTELFTCAPPFFAPVTCVSGQVPVPVFEDNLERISDGNWTTGFYSGGNHWTGGAGVPDIYWTGFSTSGRWSFWGFDVPARGDSWVASPNIAIPTRTHLRFRHFYGFEFQKDGGVVEYSLDGGVGWQALDNFTGAYPLAGLFATNPLGTRNAFTGQSWGYVTSQADLGFLAGRNARFRFRIGTDSSGGDLGWLIDDFQVQACLEKPRLEVDDVAVVEGDSGTTPAVFTVSLPGPFPLPVSADYTTEPEGAIAGLDYVETSGKLTFPPGTTSRTVSVPVIGDRRYDFDRHFRLTLRNVVNATGGFPGEGTILDDDLPGISISDVTVVEPRNGTTTATFNLTLFPMNLDAATTVSFSTADGTATAPVDYTATTGTVEFAPGWGVQTLTIPVKASPTTLSPRSFYVDLSGASSAPIVRARARATIYKSAFYSVSPCRILDTRDREGGPALSAGSTRTAIVGEKCGVPPSATAVSLNVTVVSPGAPGDLRMFAAGNERPLVSSINYAAGQTRANNAVVPLGAQGGLSVFAEQQAGEVDLVLDVNGFFE